MVSGEEAAVGNSVIALGDEVEAGIDNGNALISVDAGGRRDGVVVGWLVGRIWGRWGGGRRMTLKKGWVIWEQAAARDGGQS